MTVAEAQAMIERQQYSGVSVQEFCAQECITKANFYYWRKRLTRKENAEPPVMIPVRLENHRGHGADASPIELTYPNGVRISLPGSSSLSLIRSLILLG